MHSVTATQQLVWRSDQKISAGTFSSEYKCRLDCTLGQLTVTPPHDKNPLSDVQTVGENLVRSNVEQFKIKNQSYVRDM